MALMFNPIIAQIGIAQNLIIGQQGEIIIHTLEKKGMLIRLRLIRNTGNMIKYLKILGALSTISIIGYGSFAIKDKPIAPQTASIIQMTETAQTTPIVQTISTPEISLSPSPTPDQSNEIKNTGKIIPFSSVKKLNEAVATLTPTPVAVITPAPVNNNLVNQQIQEQKRLSNQEALNKLQEEARIKAAQELQIKQEFLSVIKQYQDEQARQEAERANKQLACDQGKNQITQEYNQKISAINAQITDLRAQLTEAIAVINSNPYNTENSRLRKISDQQALTNGQISDLNYQINSLNTEEVSALNEVKITLCGELADPLPVNNTQPIPTSYYSNSSLPSFYYINPDGMGGYNIYNRNNSSDTYHVQCDSFGLCTVYNR